MSSLQDDVGILNTLLNNLKKSINKKIAINTLQAKWNYANELYNHIESSLLDEEDTLSDSELTFLIKASRNAITEIRNILKLKFEQLNTKPKVTMPFDYKTATSIIQPYDGTADGLNAFVDSANLLKDLTEANQEALAARFLKTRLIGKARLGLADGLVTINGIIDDVKARCEDKTTPDNILAKMKTLKQQDTVEKFCDEVENLTAKLKGVYINNGIPERVSKSMSTKAGVDTLINGVSSVETKIILKASTFADIKEATQKVQENASNTSVQTAQMLNFKGREVNRQTQHNVRYNNNRNESNRLHNRGRGNFQRRPNYYAQNGNNFHSRNSFPQSNNYYQNRGRGGRYHNNLRRQIYATEAVQVQNGSVPLLAPQAAIPQAYAPTQPNIFHQQEQSLNAQNINNASNFLGQHMMQVNPHRLQ